MRQLNEWEQRSHLVRAKLDQADPIWGQVGHVYDCFDGAWIVLSDRAGTYKCSPNMPQIVQGWSGDMRARLTTWIRDQNRLGTVFPAIFPDVLTEVQQSRPLRFGAKVDRFFSYLAEIGYRPGDLIVPDNALETVESTAARHTIMRIIEAATEREFHGFMAALIADGSVIKEATRMTLSAKGLNRLDEIDALGAANDQAFVAMWFAPETETVFTEGIAPALNDLGYRPMRIDQKEHANKIDDEIIAEIRRSRFLVADFTCGTISTGKDLVGIPRGGVYYEAGFAQGLGIPVIWTVREDQLPLVHFDIRQFNQIAWKDAADLRDRLAKRIGAILGDFKVRPK